MSPLASPGPDRVPRKVYLLQIWGAAAVVVGVTVATGRVILSNLSSVSAIYWRALITFGWLAVAFVGVALFNRRRYGVTAPRFGRRLEVALVLVVLAMLVFLAIAS
ncbi:MAG: hypothetical protein F4124_00915 [Acidimicrobiia bacterium]|nr:hypothetical protein [Acidimicrobiia bacterium]MYB72380.1 hypothetical protein [Acidimicrobiia bacterium]MYH97978.1 hypothetical protein [Acidimicrobiia bacterium]